MRRASFVVTCSLLVSLTLPWAAAQVNPEIYSPVILGANMTRGVSVELRPDGSGMRDLVISGQLSTGAPGARSWLRLEQDGTTFLENVAGDPAIPYTGRYADLVVYREDGSSRRVLTIDRTMQRNNPRWSRSGRQIAFVGQRWSADATFNPQPSQVVEAGLYVLDLDFDASGMPFVVQERLVYGHTPTDPYVRATLGDLVTWSYTGRIAYTFTTEWKGDAVYAPQTSSYVLNLATGLQCQVFIDGEQRTFAWSPVDDRVVFMRPTAGGGYAGQEIYIATIPETDTCPIVIASRQITSGRNGASNVAGESGVDWSPDGKWVAFTAYKTSAPTASDIFKMPADGTGKITALTNGQKLRSNFHFSQWQQ